MFKQLINKFLCSHKWLVHNETKVLGKIGEGLFNYRQTLICEKCGKIKQIKL